MSKPEYCFHLLKMRKAGSNALEWTLKHASTVFPCVMKKYQYQTCGN